MSETCLCCSSASDQCTVQIGAEYMSMPICAFSISDIQDERPIFVNCTVDLLWVELRSTLYVDGVYLRHSISRVCYRFTATFNAVLLSFLDDGGLHCKIKKALAGVLQPQKASPSPIPSPEEGARQRQQRGFGHLRRGESSRGPGCAGKFSCKEAAAKKERRAQKARN